MDGPVTAWMMITLTRFPRRHIHLPCPACLSSYLNPTNNFRCIFTLFVSKLSYLIIEQHILRLLNTNVDGKRKVMYALTEIKGVGRRYSNIVCKKADVDLNKRCVDTLDSCQSSPLIVRPRAGELNSDELERLVTIIQNPTQFKIPLWFLNRQRDIVDGKNLQILSNGVDSKLRDDLERLKKIRAHRGLRHFWGLRVRGQHTKTTGQLHRFCPRRFEYIDPFSRSPWKDCWCVEEAWLSICSLSLYLEYGYVLVLPNTTLLSYEYMPKCRRTAHSTPWCSES